MIRLGPRGFFFSCLMCFLLIFIFLIQLFTGAAVPLVDSPDSDLSYGIIIDAGSTGSRLFLYSWRATSPDELIDIQPALDNANKPVVRKVSPGLSTFADHPHDAAEYIKPLLDYAVEFVPQSKRPYTPVFIFATAGMRLVPKAQQDEILKDLHEDLPKMTQMQILREHIKVIEGRWEGIYSWIAVNYILGRFKTRQATAAMVDMGGASVQIAFEMPTTDTFHSDSVETVNLGWRENDERFTYKLFVTTFLGFGVNEGLRKYEQVLSDRLQVDNSSGQYVRDPCLPTNLQKNVNREDQSTFMRRGIGDWESCVTQLEQLISSQPSESSCDPRCFFAGVRAPLVPLSQMEFYGFSEYWYSLEDVFDLGGEYNFTMVKKSAKNFCGKRWSEIQRLARNRLFPQADDERLRTQCFKSAWVAAVLHSGFHVDRFANRFQSAQIIKDQEVQWALGAMIYNMRHFPLRLSKDSIQGARNYSPSAGKTLPNDSTLFDFGSPLFIILVVISFVGLFILCTRLRTTRGMRRERSMWGYMMLNTDEFSTTLYKNAPSIS